jgi:hypothetical protein
MLHTDINISFDNMQEWRGIQEKVVEVNSTEAYTTIDENSGYILSGCPS